jgi:hypothetical protein
MKKEHVILLLAAVVLSYLLLRKGNDKSVQYIKPGDKGKEVYGLQAALTAITGLTFSDMGAYDNETLDMVRHYLGGTDALIDSEKGWVRKDFAKDLYLIQGKLNKVEQ